MRKHYWIGIVISVALVYLVIRSVNPESVFAAFKDANLLFLIPALLLYFTGVFVRAVRWHVLLRPVQTISVRRLFQVLTVGFMANDILPLRAGEAVRAYVLWNKERVSPGATVATILVERIFDGLTLTGFLVVGGLLVPLNDSLLLLTRAAAVIFVVGVLGAVALAIVPQFTLRVTATFLRPFPARLRDLALRVIASFENGLHILRSARETGLVLVLSVAAWSLEASVFYMLMFSFPMEARYVAAVLGAAVANLASMIPSSPGYVGTFDVGLLNVLSGTFGVETSLATAYTLLVHVVLVVPITALGIVFLWREGLSLKRITSRESYTERQVTPITPMAHVEDEAEAVARRSMY